MAFWVAGLYSRLQGSFWMATGGVLCRSGQERWELACLFVVACVIPTMPTRRAPTTGFSFPGCLRAIVPVMFVRLARKIA